MRARDTPRARARRGARSTSECARSNEHSVLSAARACTTFDTLSGCLKGTSRVSVAFHRERFNGQIRIRSRVVIRRRVPFTFARTRRSSRASLTRRARALLSRVAPVVVVAPVRPSTHTRFANRARRRRTRVSVVRRGAQPHAYTRIPCTANEKPSIPHHRRRRRRGPRWMHACMHVDRVPIGIIDHAPTP